MRFHYFLMNDKTVNYDPTVTGDAIQSQSIGKVYFPCKWTVQFSPQG